MFIYEFKKINKLWYSTRIHENLNWWHIIYEINIIHLLINTDFHSFKSNDCLSYCFSFSVSLWLSVYLMKILGGMLNNRNSRVSPTRGWTLISFCQVTINGMKILMILPLLEVSPKAVDLMLELKLYIWHSNANVPKHTVIPR